jgi:L-asparaginase
MREDIEIHIITTGGTIEKSYNEFDGSLRNRRSFLRKLLLSRLRLPHTKVQLHELMAKDSLHFTDEDRREVLQKIQELAPQGHPIVVLHGTDTMELTTRFCFEEHPIPGIPVVFTGAMKPLGFEDSDARQNLIEALMACQLLPVGYYISFHNRVFTVPWVRKSRSRRTFVSHHESEGDICFEA